MYYGARRRGAADGRARDTRGAHMTKDELLRKFEELRNEHTHYRDASNNYGCFNIERCRNCNFIYNSRGALSCHGGDSLIECIQCVDCRSCAYCVGMTGSVYAILNVEYPEAEYYRILTELGVDWIVEAE